MALSVHSQVYPYGRQRCTYPRKTVTKFPLFRTRSKRKRIISFKNSYTIDTSDARGKQSRNARQVSQKKIGGRAFPRQCYAISLQRATPSRHRALTTRARKKLQRRRRSSCRSSATARSNMAAAAAAAAAAFDDDDDDDDELVGCTWEQALYNSLAILGVLSSLLAMSIEDSFAVSCVCVICMIVGPAAAIKETKLSNLEALKDMTKK
mmetsp:Transcript_18661/g.26936  ORF Transcript_18661/g.26936 Transcript_18661/m.26936 type:complete len:208 (+) Transcript_18661:531-1154(+)